MSNNYSLFMKSIKSLYYHNPSVDGFEKMVLYYLKRGYHFVSIDELLRLLLFEKSIDEKLAFISFDDGWKGNLKLLPIIEKYKVPICIFVATEPLTGGNFWWEFISSYLGFKKMLQFKKLSYFEFYDKLIEIKSHVTLSRSALTKEELIELAKHPLVSIQSHTVNHPILTKTPDFVLQSELVDSKEILEELTNNTVFAFSYPNGSLTSREVKMCKQYYKMAFTTEQRHIRLEDNLFLLPRYALTGQYSRDLLKVWGIWKILKKIISILTFNIVKA